MSSIWLLLVLVLVVAMTTTLLVWLMVAVGRVVTEQQRDTRLP
jgi:hypothetical protein